LVTPIFFYDSAHHTIQFAYTLVTDPGQVSNVWNYDIRLYYGFGGFQNTGCTGVVTSGFGLPEDVTDVPKIYYFTVSGVDFPPGTNFLIVLKFNVPNFYPPIRATLFQIQTDATPAPEGAALPVHFNSLDAKSVSNGVNITWNVGLEDNLYGYAVEKSTNGVDYVQIGFVPAGGKTTYQFLDGAPAQGVTYYRVKFVDNDGKYAYSTVAVLKGGKAVIVLSAFPIPTKGTLTVHHATAFAGSKINITSPDGQLIRSIVPVSGTQETRVDLSTQRAGMYMIRFDNGRGETGTLKVIKQ
jgi:hypothetical protein